MSFITVDKVTKMYDEGCGTTIGPLSLTIERGEFFVIIGPSGCGKTTLLNILAGFEKPTSGEIRIDGKIVSEPSKQRIKVFQEHALFPWLTVAENVAFGLSTPADDARVIKVLQLVGLVDAAHKFPRELSGGMQQRVQLARALVLEPEVLFMDEPFAALDEITRMRLERELLALWKKKKMTIVFVTHHIESALTLATRVAVMNGSPGKISKTFENTFPRPRDIAHLTLVSLKKELLLSLDPVA